MRDTRRAEKILMIKITIAVTLVLALCFYWVTNIKGL